MKDEVKKQLDLEQKLRNFLSSDFRAENFTKVYDEYHQYILENGYPREGRKKNGALYAPKNYKNFAEEIIYKIIPQNTKILEIGIGDGRLSKRLAKNKSNQVTGIDISDLVIALANEKIESDLRLQYLKADARQLPFENNYFDIVISKDLIEHLPEKDHHWHIEEVKRVLRGGGSYIIFTPPRLMHRQFEGLHFKEYTLYELINFLSSYFKNIEIYNVQLAVLGLVFKMPKVVIKIICWYEIFLYKTGIYKLLTPLNKILIFRGVIKAYKV